MLNLERGVGTEPTSSDWKPNEYSLNSSPAFYSFYNLYCFNFTTISIKIKLVIRMSVIPNNHKHISWEVIPAFIFYDFKTTNLFQHLQYTDNFYTILIFNVKNC
jgi:hypothetical protein